MIASRFFFATIARPRAVTALCLAAALAGASACAETASPAGTEPQASRATPPAASPATASPASASMPFGPPLVALGYQLPSAAYALRFVLYEDGTALVGNLEAVVPTYRMATLGPEEVRRLQAATDADPLALYDGARCATGGASFLAALLGVRRPDGSYVTITVRRDEPGEAPGRALPPDVERAIDLLERYTLPDSPEWAPSEIVAYFHPAPPWPGYSAWWPKEWPMPDEPLPGEPGAGALRVTLRGDDCATLLGLMSAQANPEHVRIGRAAYTVYLKYTLPGESAVLPSSRPHAVGRPNRASAAIARDRATSPRHRGRRVRLVASA